MNSELVLKLILKEEARINEVEKKLETERAENEAKVQDLSKEIRNLTESLKKTELELEGNSILSIFIPF